MLDSAITSASSRSAACDDLFGRLPQARVMHVEARVEHRPHDDLGALVVAVQAGFGENDFDGFDRVHDATSASPVMGPRSLPSVARPHCAGRSP